MLRIPSPPSYAGSVAYFHAKSSAVVLVSINQSIKQSSNQAMGQSINHKQLSAEAMAKAPGISSEPGLSPTVTKAPERESTGTCITDDEDLNWDRPFSDIGRGGVPVLVIAENSPYQIRAETLQEPFHFLTSPRLIYLFSGGVAGGAARILTYPFDRARTSMLLFGHEARFRDMSTTFRTFWVDQGKWSLFRGLDINLLRMVPEIGLKFAVYEEIKKQIVSQHSRAAGKQASFHERFLAGGAAGFVSHLFTYPISVVQTRLSSQRPTFGSEFSGIRDAFAKLWKAHGFLGFYRGFLVSVTGMVPSMGLDFAIYGRLKKLYKSHFHTKGHHPPAYVLLLCGTVSSCTAHVLTYPLLLARIRMQSNDSRALKIQTLDKTMFGYLWDSYKEVGVKKGLYRGLTPSLTKVVPAVSLSYLFYEKISQALLPKKEKVQTLNKKMDIVSVIHSG